jgi:hypothetical protein
MELNTEAEIAAYEAALEQATSIAKTVQEELANKLNDTSGAVSDNTLMVSSVGDMIGDGTEATEALTG